MTWFLWKLLVRFGVFGLVFGVAAHRHEKIQIRPRYALPLVALVFAGLNAGLYWAAKPVLNIATLGMAWFLVPLLVNVGFLYATKRVLARWLRVEGVVALVWLAGLLTLAHGALYLIFRAVA